VTRALVALAAGTVAAAGVLHLHSFAFVVVLAAAAVFAIAAPII